MAGLFRGRFVQRVLVPLLAAASLLDRDRPDHRQLGAGRLASRSSRARWPSTRWRCFMSHALLRRRAWPRSLLSLRAERAREAGAGEYMALLLGSIAGMVDRWPAPRTWSRCSSASSCCRSRSTCCAPPRCATRQLARVRAEVPGGRLGRARPRCSTAWRWSTAPPATPTSRASPTRSATASALERPAAAHRRRARRRRARLQGLGRAVPPVDARRLPGRADPGHRASWPWPPRPPRSRSCCASSTRRSADAQTDWAPALAALAAITILIGNAGAIAQRSLKRMLAWSGVAQAGYLLAGVVVGTQLGLQADRLLPGRLPVDERRGVRRGDRARARLRARRRPRVAARPRPRAAPLLAWPMTIAMLVARRLPRHRRLHREVLFDRRRRGRRLRLARDRDRGRLDDLARLLPARDRRDVDGPLRRSSCPPLPPRTVKPVARLVARGRRARPARVVAVGSVPAPPARSSSARPPRRRLLRGARSWSAPRRCRRSGDTVRQRRRSGHRSLASGLRQLHRSRRAGATAPDRVPRKRPSSGLSPLTTRTP